MNQQSIADLKKDLSALCRKHNLDSGFFMFVHDGYEFYGAQVQPLPGQETKCTELLSRVAESTINTVQQFSGQGVAAN